MLAGGPPRLGTYGISDEQAGGRRSHLRRHRPCLPARASRRRAGRLEAMDDGGRRARRRRRHPARRRRRRGEVGVTGRSSRGSRESPLLDRSVARDAGGLLDGLPVAPPLRSRRGDARRRVGRPHPGFSTPPQMVVFGAIDFSAALARIASELGYVVTICDPRDASSPRFADATPRADRLARPLLRDAQLGPRDAVLVFSHDPKLDEPALLGALASGAGYIGALGSRRTSAARRAPARCRGADAERGIPHPAGSTSAPAPRRDRDLGARRDHRAAHGPPGRAGCATSGPIHPESATATSA